MPNTPAAFDAEQLLNLYKKATEGDSDALQFMVLEAAMAVAAGRTLEQGETLTQAHWDSLSSGAQEIAKQARGV